MGISRMTADNNSTEDKPDPTPFKVYSMTNEARSKRMRGGPTREFASKEQAIKFAGRQVGGYYAVCHGQTTPAPYRQEGGRYLRLRRRARARQNGHETRGWATGPLDTKW